MKKDLISFYNKSDFEKNLFLKREIKELKETYSASNIRKTISERDIEIGKLKAEIEELKHNKKPFDNLPSVYSSMSVTQKKNFKKSYKDEFTKTLKSTIANLQNKIIELSKT